MCPFFCFSSLLHGENDLITNTNIHLFHKNSYTSVETDYIGDSTDDCGNEVIVIIYIKDCFFRVVL